MTFFFYWQWEWLPKQSVKVSHTFRITPCTKHSIGLYCLHQRIEWYNVAFFFFFFFSYRLVIEFISLRTAPSWSLFIRAVSLESYHFLNISFTRSLETDYSKLVVGLLPSLSPSLFTLPSPSILALFSPPSILPSYFSPPSHYIYLSPSYTLFLSSSVHD